MDDGDMRLSAIKHRENAQGHLQAQARKSGAEGEPRRREDPQDRAATKSFLESFVA